MKKLASFAIASMLLITLSVTVMASSKSNEPVSQAVPTSWGSYRTEVLENGSQSTTEIHSTSPKEATSYVIEKYTYLPDEVVAK